MDFPRPSRLLGALLLAWLGGCVPAAPPAPGMLETDPLPTWPDLGPGGDACERTPLEVAPQAPQIVLLLDRSGSMGAARWDPARQAVIDLTAGMDASWQVGFGLFPNAEAEDDCGMSGLDVFPEPGRAAQIEAILVATRPHGSTPTTEALGFAGEALATLREADGSMAMPREQAIVLVTDGASNCNPLGNINDSIILTTEAVRALRTDGVQVYVIGYDIGSTGLAGRALSDWALTGGTEVPRHVRDGETLSAELHVAVAATAPCSFAIPTVPQDPALLRIRLDQRVLQRKVDYELVPGAGIRLSPATCASIRDGETHPLAAELLCVPDFG